MRISELMTEDVTTVRPETPLKDVAMVLTEHHISGLPVVGEEGGVLGVVSEADILIKERGPEARLGGLFGWLFDDDLGEREKLFARTAGEAMTSPAITIGARKNVAEAARLMTEHGIKRLPVVDRNSRLIGIVTRADLVKAFARSDAEIEREIREDVVRRTLLIVDESDLEVRVERGAVTLSGRLERKTDAEILPRFVARVPGVVSVDSTLTWAWDDEKAVESSNPRVPVPPHTS